MNTVFGKTNDGMAQYPNIFFNRILFLSISVLTYVILSFLLASNVHGSDETASFNQSDAIDSLKSAVKKFDQLDNVPDKAWLWTDKKNIAEDINDILDETISILDIPDLVELRKNYRQLERAIILEQDRISNLKESRLLAPEGESSFARFIPTQTMKQWTATTTGDFDSLIEAGQKNIIQYQSDMRAIEAQLSESLSKIGIELNPEQVEFWLSSVIGDDVLSMSIVFSNIKDMTNLLADLTKESGENINYAKRYYGMLVMLHQLVINMQDKFIMKVDDEILPKLEDLSKEAEANIQEARKLIKSGGSRTSLEYNISANEITKQTIELYRKSVTDHRDKVSRALVISKNEIRVAVNTYKTVRLSSDVMALIREGLDTFETLMNLQIPAANVFQNNAIREEFRKLSEKMK